MFDGRTRGELGGRLTDELARRRFEAFPNLLAVSAAVDLRNDWVIVTICVTGF